MPNEINSAVDSDKFGDAFLQGFLSLGLKPEENSADKSEAISVLGSMAEPDATIDMLVDRILNAAYNGLDDTTPYGDGTGVISSEDSGEDGVDFGEKGPETISKTETPEDKADTMGDAFIQGLLSFGLKPEENASDKNEAIAVLGGIIGNDKSMEDTIEAIRSAPYNGVYHNPTDFGEVDPSVFDTSDTLL